MASYTHSSQSRGLRPVTELAARRPHGDRLRYLAGCRCPECRHANPRDESERQQARRRGEWNGLVSAKTARAPIRKLPRAGFGRRSIAAVADIRATTIADIRTGKQRQIRAMTAHNILAVTPDLASDYCLVPAGRLWQRIHQHLDEGDTRQAIAPQLGYCELQFGTYRVTARNRSHVEQLYERLTASHDHPTPHPIPQRHAAPSR